MEVHLSFFVCILLVLQLEVNAFLVKLVETPLNHYNNMINHQFKRPSFVVVYDQRWNREIEENSRKKAQGGGMGETVAGAVLGSLVLGPFGALFGASLGANIGARKAQIDARKAEMERLGLSQDMLDMAEDVGASLQKSMEGVKAVQDSLETQQKLARLLDSEAAILYDRATKALKDSDEDLARKLLLDRTAVQEKLKTVLVSCTEEKKRLQKMEDYIAQLEKRALEIDSLLRRTVSAKSLKSSADLDLSLQMEDPLLKKFKELGID